jgi:hypothetical protein
MKKKLTLEIFSFVICVVNEIKNMPMAGLDPATSALLNAVYKHGNLTNWFTRAIKMFIILFKKSNSEWIFEQELHMTFCFCFYNVLMNQMIW